MTPKKVHPNFRKPPRPEPAVILPFDITDDGEHVVIPLFVRPCDLLKTWAVARSEAEA